MANERSNGGGQRQSPGRNRYNVNVRSDTEEAEPNSPHSTIRTATDDSQRDNSLPMPNETGNLVSYTGAIFRSPTPTPKSTMETPRPTPSGSGAFETITILERQAPSADSSGHRDMNVQQGGRKRRASTLEKPESSERPITDESGGLRDSPTPLSEHNEDTQDDSLADDEESDWYDSRDVDESETGDEETGVNRRSSTPRPRS